MKLATLFLLLAFTLGCNKEKSTGDVTFYTTSTERWGLLVDGKEYGKIKHSTQAPNCGDPAFQKLSLSIGSHVVGAIALDTQTWGGGNSIYVKLDTCMTINLP